MGTVRLPKILVLTIDDSLSAQLEVLAPLPADQPIRCTAQVVDVQDGRASPPRTQCARYLSWQCEAGNTMNSAEQAVERLQVVLGLLHDSAVTRDPLCRTAVHGPAAG